MKLRSRPIFNLFTLMALLVSLLGSAVFVTPAYAAGIVVNSNADTVADDGVCTLREAITNANGDSQLYATAGECATGVGSDTITFAADYTITLVGSQLPAVTTTIIINGNGAENTIVQANANPNTATYRVFQVSGNLTLDKLTVQNGRCNGSCAVSNYIGGGIYSNYGTLIITNSAISGNSSGNGGGIYINNGTLNIANSTISNNSNGGISSNYSSTVVVNNSTISNNFSMGFGGGILNDDSSTLTITKSTIDANQVQFDGGGVFNLGALTITNSTFSNNSAAAGGGIYNNDTLTVTNSTFSGNSSGIGGGIFNYSTGIITVNNSTIYGNSGEGIYNSGGTAILKNTIVGNNSNNDDCFGTVTANSYNLDTDGSCNNATQKTLVQINLAALADNGGPTQTHALLVGSQAIDAGDNTVCNIAPVSNFDQRDYLRDASCDVGSYEYGALDTVAPDVTSFTVTSPSLSLNIPITTFTASDAEGVAGYMVTTSSTPPAVGDVGWAGTVPAVYTVITDGNYTLYPWAKDAAGNISTVFAPASVTVDTTAPIVSSSLRASTSPSALLNVNFTVTFSESVTGVDTSDFDLTTNGVSGATVSGISGTGSLYTVSVNTGSSNGTIRLNVLNDGSIKDITLNPLGSAFNNGEVYTISKPATFSDVSLTYWASSYIERLYHAGITGGCGTGIYCPDATVTRAQMAVFLLKGMHGSSYIPPAVGLTTGFGDVATDYWAAAWIKQLAAEGITSGCGGGNYCPDATVTRAQMAIFLLKAKHGSSYSPPNASGVFTDVPVGYWADKWIEQLAVEGVTSGCGNGNYCPDNSVTRAQMAVFLVKAFNLP